MDVVDITNSDKDERQASEGQKEEAEKLSRLRTHDYGIAKPGIRESCEWENVGPILSAHSGLLGDPERCR